MMVKKLKPLSHRFGDSRKKECGFEIGVDFGVCRKSKECEPPRTIFHSGTENFFSNSVFIHQLFNSTFLVFWSTVKSP